MRKTLSGFTIVELIIVITVIGIMAALAAFSFSSVTAKSRDSQRSTKINMISEALEKYYSLNGEYPSCSDMSQPSATVAANTLKGINADALATPTAASGTNSILPNCGDMATGYTSDSFAYLGDSNCRLSPYTSTCSNWILKYREEATGNIISLSSRHLSSTLAMLTITAGTNGTVNAIVNGNYTIGSTPTITATPNSGYLFNNWTGSAGCNNITTASFAITMNSSQTCTANFIIIPPWINGLASTAMAGKKVRNADLSGTYQYKTTDTSVTSPQGATGLDPNYLSNYSLVSPQANTGVDFSAYPAQNACKAISGRLPNMQELLAIYADKASYGNNFQAGAPYRSSTENGSIYAYLVIFDVGNTGFGNKSNSYPVRCVSD